LPLCDLKQSKRNLDVPTLCHYQPNMPLERATRSPRTFEHYVTTISRSRLVMKSHRTSSEAGNYMVTPLHKKGWVPMTREVMGKNSRHHRVPPALRHTARRTLERVTNLDNRLKSLRLLLMSLLRGYQTSFRRRSQVCNRGIRVFPDKEKIIETSLMTLT
jgi:hypothetical protein